MHSPSAALAWDIWRRHGKRLSVIVLLILSFALFYPGLCARIGLNVNSANGLDELATTLGQQMKHGPSVFNILQIIFVLFLLLGPLGCMILSLLYVIWISTFAQVDTKRGWSVPARLFTLPVSTTFLASWLLAAGSVAVIAVYVGWTQLVHQPHIEVFEGYRNCLAWLTLLVVSQGVTWALDAFPVARTLLSTACLFGFGWLAGPAHHDSDFFERNMIAVLLTFLVTGIVFAVLGLSKIRHGAWQRFPLVRRLVLITARAKLNPESAFRSQARAQFWFEWRRHARKLFFYVCALTIVPFLFMAVVAAEVGFLSEDDMFGLTLYLLAVPLFIHFFHGLVPERTVLPFTAIRPLTDGEIVMAKLKTVALSSVLSWAVTLPLVAALPLLGDLHTVLEHIPLFVQYQHLLRPMLVLILPGLVFLSWRFTAADLCFGSVGKSWIANGPILKYLAFGTLLGVVFYLSRDPQFDRTLFRILPMLLALPLVLKFILALWAFRTSLRKKLLASSAVITYLVVWAILALVFLIPALVLFHQERWIVSLCLGILLLLPLARIGFSPIALSYARHG